jgi:hypothetical protein
MRAPLNAACGWLKQAENARKTAEQLTDREAKEVMAQLGQMYFLLAQNALIQNALIQVTGLESSNSVTQLGMLQRCNSVATSGGVRPSNAKVH